MCKVDSWMLYFGRVDSSWRHRAFFGSLWEEKVITSYFFFISNFWSSLLNKEGIFGQNFMKENLYMRVMKKNCR